MPNSHFQTRFIIDHAETISERNIERIGALGGGIAIQHRMAFQGEFFIQRYGKEAAANTPARETHVGIGRACGCRHRCHTSGFLQSVGVFVLVKHRQNLGRHGFVCEDSQLLDRETALALWSKGSAWFSGEQALKGALVEGEFADLAVLSDDYFQVEAEDIQWIESVLTVVGGRVVYAGAEFKHDDLSYHLHHLLGRQ